MEPAIFFNEKYGHMCRWDKAFESNDKLEDVIQQIVAGANRQVNEASPIVDARLADGSRVNVVLKPVALNGPILTIRKFPEEPMKYDPSDSSGRIDRRGSGIFGKNRAGKIQYIYFRRYGYGKNDHAQCTDGICAGG